MGRSSCGIETGAYKVTDHITVKEYGMESSSMQLDGTNVILRDPVEEDLADHIEWNTRQIEWKEWDAPWKQGAFDEERLRNKQEGYLERAKHSGNLRFHWEIDAKIENCWKHIGWMNVYCIDKRYQPVDESRDLAFGIDIPNPEARGKGFGLEAVKLLISYYEANGYREMYTQTWSGNKRMIALAKKAGFLLVKRTPDIYRKDGISYEQLTFVSE